MEEALTRDQLAPGRLPGAVTEFADGVPGEREQVEGNEHGGEMALAMPEVVLLEVVSLGIDSSSRPI